MADRTYFKAAVFVIVFNDNGDVLLHCRANTGYMDGYYDFPSGHIELGELITTAAARELKEEAGLVVKEKDLQLVRLNQNIFGHNYLNYVFMAKKWQGRPTIGEPDSCSDIGFFPIDKLPTKCTVSVRDIAQTGFSQDLTYSVVDRRVYEELMGEPFPIQ